MINKFADKLDHLTPDQVNEVMELFADPSIKVKEILEAYNIDVSACYLGRILPPISSDNSSSDSNTSVEPSASAENEKSTVLDGEIDTELRRQYNGK